MQHFFFVDPECGWLVLEFGPKAKGACPAAQEQVLQISAGIGLPRGLQAGHEACYCTKQSGFCAWKAHHNPCRPCLHKHGQLLQDLISPKLEPPSNKPSQSGKRIEVSHCARPCETAVRRSRAPTEKSQSGGIDMSPTSASCKWISITLGIGVRESGKVVGGSIVKVQAWGGSAIRCNAHRSELSNDHRATRSRL